MSKESREDRRQLKEFKVGETVVLVGGGPHFKVVDRHPRGYEVVIENLSNGMRAAVPGSKQALRVGF